MSSALLGLALLIFLVSSIVYFIKGAKKKKAGDDNAKEAKKCLISVICFIVCVVLIGIIPSNKEPETSETNEKTEFYDLLGDNDPTRYDSVRNDATGNWRELVVYSDKSIDKDIAIAYSKAYIKSDDEVHFIVNLKLKTTTRIKKVGNVLSVSCHEYRENEELDAKELCGGMELEQFNVNIETGEIQ